VPVSNSQRRLACVALSIKRGETKSSYSKEAASMAASMSEEKLSEWCYAKKLEKE
jgi:hypothetical protein